MAHSPTLRSFRGWSEGRARRSLPASTGEGGARGGREAPPAHHQAAPSSDNKLNLKKKKGKGKNFPKLQQETCGRAGGDPRRGIWVAQKPPGTPWLFSPASSLLKLEDDQALRPSPGRKCAGGRLGFLLETRGRLVPLGAGPQEGAAVASSPANDIHPPPPLTGPSCSQPGLAGVGRSLLLWPWRAGICMGVSPRLPLFSPLPPRRT